MNTQVKIVLKGLKYPEGPFYSSRDHCLYFAEWLGDRLLGYRDDRTWIVYQAMPGSGPSGISQHPDGTLWACLYSAGQVVQINQRGELQQVFSDWYGNHFKGPNDLVHTPEGGLFFTDSGNFQEDWISGRPAGSIYYLSGQGDLRCAATEIAYANGIGISADGRGLYVAEHRRNRILYYDIVEPGVLINRRVFADLDDNWKLDPEKAYELGPDGICLDEQGRLWVAHYGGGKIIGLDREGETQAVLHLPEGRCPTNLTWVAEEKALYLTEAELGMLLRIQL